jgi:hypothetical protein
MPTAVVSLSPSGRRFPAEPVTFPQTRRRQILQLFAKIIGYAETKSLLPFTTA